MRQQFTDNPVYRKRARLLAILWTLLIFFLCFLPGRELPDVKVPLADKWAHCILFGVFAFLWLMSLRDPGIAQLLLVLAASVLLGWLVELIQGSFRFLGRSQDDLDTLADSIGGLAGVLIFSLYHRFRRIKQPRGGR